MKHIKLFNESKKTFKNTNKDIQEFFINYFDTERLKIKDALLRLSDNQVIDTTSYLKDTKNFRKCKVISIRLTEPNGTKIGMTKCLTNLDVLNDVIEDIKNFYEFLEEDINYMIDMDYKGLTIKFVTIGDEVDESESDSQKIDEYLKEIKTVIAKYGHKRSEIKGNWLDIKFPAKGTDYSFGISRLLTNVGSGQLNLQNTQRENEIELINIRNRAWEDGLKFTLSGGDRQVVLQFVKI